MSVYTQWTVTFSELRSRTVVVSAPSGDPDTIDRALRQDGYHPWTIGEVRCGVFDDEDWESDEGDEA